MYNTDIREDNNIIESGRLDARTMLQIHAVLMLRQVSRSFGLDISLRQAVDLCHRNFGRCTTVDIRQFTDFLADYVRRYATTKEAR